MMRWIQLVSASALCFGSVVLAQDDVGPPMKPKAPPPIKAKEFGGEPGGRADVGGPMPGGPGVPGGPSGVGGGPGMPGGPVLGDPLTEALRNNPEIRVAEAKVRLAEAELQQTRLTILQKVASLRISITAKQNSLEAAIKAFKRAEALRERGGLTQEEFDAAEINLARARAEVEIAQAELNALLGRGRADGGPPMGPGAMPGGGGMGGRGILIGPGGPGGEGSAPPAGDTEPALPMAHVTGLSANAVAQLSITLNKKIILRETIEKPLDEALKTIFQPLNGELSYRLAVNPELRTTPVILPRGQLTMIALLQAICDSSPELSIVVREYGILITRADRIPSDGMTLTDFLRAMPRIPEKSGVQARPSSMSGNSMQLPPRKEQFEPKRKPKEEEFEQE